MVGPAALASGFLVVAAVFSSRLAVANPLLLAAACTAFWALRRGELQARPWARPLWAPAALFALASLLSAVFSRDPIISGQQLPRLLVFLLLPLAAALLTLGWWRALVWGLAGTTLTLSLWGIWQYLHGFDSLARRIRGPLSHYMTYAGWLLLALGVLLAMALLAPWRWRALLFLPVVAAMVALFLSFTRNAWVGLGVGVLVLAACWRRRLLLAYPVIALVVLLLFPQSVRQRLVSIWDLRQPANFDRLCMVYAGWQMVRDHPLTGVGLDMVPKAYPLYRRDDAPRFRVPHLHNNLLQIAAERGLVAFAAYLWLLGAFFVQTWRSLPSLAQESRAAVTAALTGVASVTAAGLFEYNFWDAEIQYLTLVLMGGALGLTESEG